MEYIPRIWSNNSPKLAQLQPSFGRDRRKPSWSCGKKVIRSAASTLLDRLALDEVLAQDPGNLHHQHPNLGFPDPTFDLQTRVKLGPTGLRWRIASENCRALPVPAYSMPSHAWLHALRRCRVGSRGRAVCESQDATRPRPSMQRLQYGPT
jgi:hypothetical protein